MCLISKLDFYSLTNINPSLSKTGFNTYNKPIKCSKKLPFSLHLYSQT